jgi:hypothetical protein
MDAHLPQSQSPANAKSFEIINIGKDLPKLFGKSALKNRLRFVETYV